MNSSVKSLAIRILIFLLGQANLLSAQQIYLDRPVRAESLTLFPSITDSLTYYYLPDKVTVAQNESGTPQFSFMRYVENNATSSSNSITESDGGGIVHALVNIQVDNQTLLRAENRLHQINPEAKIQGPIIFAAGRMALISSVANPDGKLRKQILGIGNAPLLEGHKAAVSMHLNKKGTQILWNTFKTPTPDISFSFEMQVDGYLSPISAKIEADFDQIYKHHQLEAAVAMPVLAAEVSAAFDDLRKSGAIKVTNVAADENMDQLIEVAYQKIAEMMFEPMGNDQRNYELANNRKSALDRATDNLNKARDDANRRNREVDQRNKEKRQDMLKAIEDGGSASWTEEGKEDLIDISVALTYQFKQVRHSGKFVLDLSKSMTTQKTFRMDENIGDLKKQCQNCFSEVNLSDPLYQQREITAYLDGLNAPDFEKYINFVTVGLKKKHQGGNETLQEIRISRQEFNQLGNQFKMLYGWDHDKNRSKWLDYNYRVKWSFFGDHEVEEEWKTQDQAAINLAPPFHPCTVSVEADSAMLQAQQIRMVIVKFFYDYGAGEKFEQVTLQTNKLPLAKRVNFMLKKDHYHYDYEITWRLSGNKTITSGRKKTSDILLYVDEIPEDALVVHQ